MDQSAAREQLWTEREAGHWTDASDPVMSRVTSGFSHCRQDRILLAPTGTAVWTWASIDAVNSLVSTGGDARS